MTAAFKEWAIVVDALGRGEQIFILRKGGIHEGKEGFELEHKEFALFPTLFHQQRESVIDAAQKRFDQMQLDFPARDAVRIEFFARVVESETLHDLSDLERLRGQHIWRDSVLKDRFEWGTENGINAIVTRVFRLETALELPLVPEYGGCKSWVELTHEISFTKASPVLSDRQFDARLEVFRNSLHRI
jgi:hypothetical protein